MGEKSLMSKGGNSNINLNDNVQRATTLVFKVKKNITKDYLWRNRDKCNSY